jgi:AcrR family transcriptional regulator
MGGAWSQVQRGVKRELPALGPGKGAQTSRGLRRRSLILKVAATLFAEHGFDSVSINEIGVDAGITGPAIYRYFPSKEALLVSIYEHLYRRTRDGVNDVLAGGIGGRDALERMIDLQIDLAIEESEKIRIVNSEERHLPVKEAEELRAESRRLLRVWTDLVREARPELGREDCDATVHAVLALINSVTFKREDGISALVRAHLRAMALGAVLTPAVHVSGTRIA